MQNNPKQAKGQSTTELKFSLLPTLPFYLNLYDNFLEGTKIPLLSASMFGIFFKDLELRMFLGICLGRRERVILQKFLYIIIKHINLFILLMLVLWV